MTRHLFKITWKWSNAKKLVGSQFTIILVPRSPPGGHPTKFYTGGPRPNFPPQEPFINCGMWFWEKRYPFDLPFTFKWASFYWHTFHLRQNKMEQQTPIPSESRMKPRESQHASFSHPWFWGESGYKFFIYVVPRLSFNRKLHSYLTAVTAPYFTL